MAVVFVSGFPRCGSSLTMQMLHATGLRCAGEHPDFEHAETSPGRTISLRFASRFQAIKRLEPAFVGVERGIDLRTIWIDRDANQQARSQLMMMAAFGAPVRVSRANVRKVAQSIIRDRANAISAIAGHPVLVLSFEKIIGDSVAAACAIAEFIAPVSGAVSVEKMLSVIIPRSPDAQGDLRLEASLIMYGNAVPDRAG